MTDTEIDNVPTVFQNIVDSWKPCCDTAEGAIGLWPASALAALLGTPGVSDGDELPPLWHELYLRPVRDPAELGADGHPIHDVLVPDIAERRRMFGGGRLHVYAPIRIGDRVRRTSSIESITTRHGRSGWLLLVTEKHELAVGDEVNVVDERDIVYRLPSDVADAVWTPSHSRDPVPPGATSLYPDERLLFMFSALTYNVHRIHYDRNYTTDVEGHPDLVVHGPLLALQALECARARLGVHASSVEYRLLAPAYCGHRIDFDVRQKAASTATVLATQEGRTCLSLTVTT